jgi:5-formyltetrahydrofolate cyclo-ligase
MTFTDSPIREQNSQLRKRISAERSILPDAIRMEKSTIICQKVLEHIQLQFDGQRDYVLYTYIPFRAELNVMPIVEWCWQNGISVAAPRVLSLEKELQFHYIVGPEDLQPQQPWGIIEPSADAPMVDYLSDPGLMLIPGVAFDANKTRLGYGGGYYDKFLHSMHVSGASIYKLAPVFDFQIVEVLPSEPHDFPMDKIVTESRVFE